MSLTATHRFSEKIDVSASWVFSTGNAATFSFHEYAAADSPNYQQQQYYFPGSYSYMETLPHVEARNNFRYNNYHRLDLGVNFHKIMKRAIYTLLLSILTASFISCEKDIEFKGDISNPMLVLNSMLTPDSAVTVHLSQSRFVLGESKPITPVTDATVSLFLNGDLKEQLVHVANGIYKGTYFPMPGDEITIDAVADGHDRIETHSVIPTAPNVAVNDSTVTFTESEHNSSLPSNSVYKITYRNMQVQLQLTDAADEENYYYIKATRNYYREGELLTSWPLELKLSELLKNNIDGGNFIFEELFGEEDGSGRTDNLFSDLLVNGKDILFDFSFHDPVEYVTCMDGEKINNDMEEEVTVEYVVEIAQVSKDIYQD